MTFLPIVGRELRVASRRRSTFWSRTIAALGAIVVGAFMQVVSRSDAPYEFGKNLFNILAYMSMIYCLFSGVRATADCLSEEKREGTLGLLFLTDLKGYDVVFGKLAATSLGAFYGLLAIFPVMAIPLLMGGVTNGELWRVSLVLVNTFLFSLAVGIFVSSMSKSSRKAMAATFSIILFFSLGIYIIIELLPRTYWTTGMSESLKLPNPFYSFGLSWDADFKRATHEFWTSVITIHVMTWGFILIASFIVPRSWQDKPSGTRAAGWRHFWHTLSYGDANERHAFRKRLLDINAFYWLSGRVRLKPAHVWAVLGIIGCFWAWGCLKVGKEWFNEAVYITTAVVVNFVLKFWVTSEAGRQLGEDRKMGSLELVLSTPLSVKDIIGGQILALRRQFLGPVVVAVVIEVLFFAASLRGQDHGDDFSFIVFWAGVLITLVADMLALMWVSMWLALTSRNPNRTTGIALVRVIVLPALVFIALTVLVSLTKMASNSDMGPATVLCLWFGCGLAADFVFGTLARRRLIDEFRVLAMHRFAPPKSKAEGMAAKVAQPAPPVAAAS